MGKPSKFRSTQVQKNREKQWIRNRQEIQMENTGTSVTRRTWNWSNPASARRLPKWLERGRWCPLKGRILTEEGNTRKCKGAQVGWPNNWTTTENYRCLPEKFLLVNQYLEILRKIVLQEVYYSQLSETVLSLICETVLSLICLSCNKCKLLLTHMNWP